MKLGLAAVASVALTFGAAMPAFAADVQLGPSNIASHENGNEDSQTWNYDKWHIGSTENPDATLDMSVAFQECSVTMKASPFPDEADWVQVMKGFTIDGRPSSAVPGSVKGLVDSTSIEVVTGEVTIQIPVFISLGEQVQFTTLRSQLLQPGTYDLAGLMVSNSRISLIPDGEYTFAQLVDLLATPDAPGVQVLGVGFNGNENASVKRLSFAGTNNFFGTGSCLPAALTPPTKVETAA